MRVSGRRSPTRPRLRTGGLPPGWAPPSPKPDGDEPARPRARYNRAPNPAASPHGPPPPREVVPAAFTAPECRVPPVRLKSPRLDHPQQPCRGQHLARARRQRLGKRLRVRFRLRTRGTPRSPRTAPARRPLHHDHLEPPPRKQPGRRRPGGATTQNENFRFFGHGYRSAGIGLERGRNLPYLLRPRRAGGGPRGLTATRKSQPRADAPIV